MRKELISCRLSAYYVGSRLVVIQTDNGVYVTKSLEEKDSNKLKTLYGIDPVTCNRVNDERLDEFFEMMKVVKK